MSLPTGGEEDDMIFDAPATPATPNTPPNIPPIPVTPEVRHRAEESAGEIVRLSQEVEIMAQTRVKLEAALKRSELAADILEGKALRHTPIIKHIPLVRRIGIPVDALIGLIPGVGDALAAAASLYIVAEAHNAGVPWSEIKKMLTKVAIDTGLGAVPVVGDIFDYFYKSNNYNVEIFRKYVQEYIAKHDGLKGKSADAQARKRFEESRHIDDIS